MDAALPLPAPAAPAPAPAFDFDFASLLTWTDADDAEANRLAKDIWDAEQAELAEALEVEREMAQAAWAAECLEEQEQGVDYGMVCPVCQYDILNGGG